MGSSDEWSRKNQVRRVGSKLSDRSQDNFSQILLNNERDYRRNVDRVLEADQTSTHDYRLLGEQRIQPSQESGVRYNFLTGARSMEEDRNNLASLLAFVIARTGRRFVISDEEWPHIQSEYGLRITYDTPMRSKLLDFFAVGDHIHERIEPTYLLEPPYLWLNGPSVDDSVVVKKKSQGIRGPKRKRTKRGRRVVRRDDFDIGDEVTQANP